MAAAGQVMANQQLYVRRVGDDGGNSLSHSAYAAVSPRPCFLCGACFVAGKEPRRRLRLMLAFWRWQVELGFQGTLLGGTSRATPKVR